MSKQVTQEVAPKAAPKRSKKLSMRSPFVKYEVGVVVSGIIELFGNATSKFGSKETVSIKLDSEFGQIVKVRGKPELQTYQPGEVVRLEIKPGLQAITSLAIGTRVTVTVTGQVDTGKGNPAWSFDVEYD